MPRKATDSNPAPRVKGGGRTTAAGFQFELSGGALCLDFVNTLDNRHAPAPKERLRGYADLVSWAVQAGATGEELARALAGESRRRPAAARTLVRRARALREKLFALFSAAAAGRHLPEPELQSLNPALGRALGRLRLSPTSGPALRWDWDQDPKALDSLLWPVLRSAADLLTSPGLSRVRECAATTCRWLFLDESRNRSRRWCDMTVCGNREKVRRHRRRVRPGRGRPFTARNREPAAARAPRRRARGRSRRPA